MIYCVFHYTRFFWYCCYNKTYDNGDKYCGKASQPYYPYFIGRLRLWHGICGCSTLTENIKRIEI